MLEKNGVVSVESLIRAKGEINHMLDVEYSETWDENSAKVEDTYADGYHDALEKAKVLVSSLLDDIIDL